MGSPWSGSSGAGTPRHGPGAPVPCRRAPPVHSDVPRARTGTVRTVAVRGTACHRAQGPGAPSGTEGTPQAYGEGMLHPVAAPGASRCGRGGTRLAGRVPARHGVCTRRHGTGHRHSLALPADGARRAPGRGEAQGCAALPDEAVRRAPEGARTRAPPHHLTAHGPGRGPTARHYQPAPRRVRAQQAVYGTRKPHTTKRAMPTQPRRGVLRVYPVGHWRYEGRPHGTDGEYPT